MLQTNDRIASGTDRLKDINSVTLDMENTANSILGDLASQVRGGRERWGKAEPGWARGRGYAAAGH